MYGFAVDDDNELFGRLVLEMNKAGLNWTMILKKEESFRKAFDDFDITTIARYGQTEKVRLLNDAAIIRKTALCTKKYWPLPPNGLLYYEY